MDPSFIAVARENFNLLKELMIQTKDKAVMPTAIVITPSGSFMVVMDLKTLTVEYCFKELAVYVQKTQAIAVVIVSAGFTTCLEIGPGRVTALLASIYTPSEPVYTIAQLYTVIDGEPVFTEEMESNTKRISPWQIPSLWNSPETTIQ